MDQTDGQHRSAVAVSKLTEVEPVVLRQVAELMIVAWSRVPVEEEVQQRVARLEEALRQAEPDREALFVAEQVGRIVGFGRAMRDKVEASQWMLFALVVHPEHRRKGIGMALTQARTEYARQHGAK